MSDVPFLCHGIALRGFDSGAGQPLVFQHGLGGSAAQVAESVPDLPGWRRLTLACRGQDGSEPGPRHGLAIATFTDDVLGFCDARGVDRRMVAGGISMGAAIALRMAVRYPSRIRALILARPAWLFDAGPANMRPYAEVAAALRGGPDRKAGFRRSETAALLAEEAPDNLASLLGFFDRPNAAGTADLLEAIAADGPGVTRAEAAALRVPTLVIGHGIDHAHPLAMARDLAATIPGAQWVEIPPKATDKPAHVAAFRAAVTRFLQALEPETDPTR